MDPIIGDETNGYITALFHSRHYGFINSDSLGTIFLRFSDFKGDVNNLRIGQQVQFILGRNPKGWVAHRCEVEGSRQRISAIFNSSSNSVNIGALNLFQVKGNDSRKESIEELVASEYAQRFENDVLRLKENIIHNRNGNLLQQMSSQILNSCFHEFFYSQIDNIRDDTNSHEWKWIRRTINQPSAQSNDSVSSTGYSQNRLGDIRYNYSLAAKYLFGLLPARTEYESNSQLQNSSSVPDQLQFMAPMRSLSLEMVLKTHAFVGHELIDEAGQFRTSRNTRCGYESFIPYQQVKSAMEEFIQNVDDKVFNRTDLAAYAKAALVMFHLIRVHPFNDGNGRTMRLIGNYVLLKCGVPFPVNFCSDPESRKEYITACRCVDARQLCQYVAKCVVRSYEKFEIFVRHRMEAFMNSSPRQPPVKFTKDADQPAYSSNIKCDPTNELSELSDQLLSSHRKRQREQSVCMICLLESPTASMLCCGSPTHFYCMATWKSTATQDGSRKCPTCRHEFSEIEMQSVPKADREPENEDDDSSTHYYNDDEDSDIAYSNNSNLENAPIAQYGYTRNSNISIHDDYSNADEDSTRIIIGATQGVNGCNNVNNGGNQSSTESTNEYDEDADSEYSDTTIAENAFSSTNRARSAENNTEEDTLSINEQLIVSDELQGGNNIDDSETTSVTEKTTIHQLEYENYSNTSSDQCGQCEDYEDSTSTSKPIGVPLGSKCVGSNGEGCANDPALDCTYLLCRRCCHFCQSSGTSPVCTRHGQPRYRCHYR